MFKWFRKHKDDGKPKGILAAVNLPKHEHDLATIKLHDTIFDKMTDNDDMEDYDTIIIVKYCKSCGKIISVSPSNKFGERSDTLSEVAEFEKITGIDHRTVTLWKEPKPLKDFRKAYTWD